MPLDILKSVQLSYDYSQITGAHVNVVIQAAMEIKPRLKRAAQDVYAIGEQLNTVKALIPHGQWADWLNVEFELTDRTARNFMAVADRFAGKTEIISDLPPTALYLLAAPSTPDAVVEDVTAKAAAGERVRVADVKQAISAAKPTASVDDLTRHIGSWLSQQSNGTPGERLTNAASRETVTRRHLELFLGRRDVAFKRDDLETAIAEVMANVVNTGAQERQSAPSTDNGYTIVRNPRTGVVIPQLIGKPLAQVFDNADYQIDEREAAADEAAPSPSNDLLPTVNGEPKPLIDWTDEDWNNYRTWKGEPVQAETDEREAAADEAAAQYEAEQAKLAQMRDLSRPMHADTFAEWTARGWKILMPGGRWQAVHHNEQIATEIASSKEALLKLMQHSAWSEDFYFIDNATEEAINFDHEIDELEWYSLLAASLDAARTHILTASGTAIEWSDQPSVAQMLPLINSINSAIIDATNKLDELYTESSP